MDKFITRGISKSTGKFVYGYPCYFVSKKAYGIFEYGNCNKSIEITQDPDRFFTEIKGIKYWENDIFEYIDHLNPYPNFQLKWNGWKWSNHIGTVEEFAGYCNRIGNIHFNKELLEEK